jgi:hypothetical protein
MVCPSESVRLSYIEPRTTGSRRDAVARTAHVPIGRLVPRFTRGGEAVGNGKVDWGDEAGVQSAS